MENELANVPIIYLRSLVAMVEHRSYKEASRIIGRAPGTMWFHIKAIEDLCGFPLMQKHQRKGIPTELGLIVYQQAKILLTANYEFSVIVKRLRKDVPPVYNPNI